MRELLKKSSWILGLIFLDLFFKGVFRSVDWRTSWNFGIFGTLNDGAVFGWFAGMNTLILVLSLFLIVVLINAYQKYPEFQRGTGFVLAGAVGNTVDRILYGGVIDFIHFGFWPTFNLADVFIVVGVVLILIKSWRK